MREVPISIVIEPIFWNNPPMVRVGVNRATYYQGELREETDFSWRIDAKDLNTLEVALLNKCDADTIDGKDKALLIKSVSIEGMTLDSFLQKSRYGPEYTAGYYDYAIKNGIIVEEILYGQTYLGFNGLWSLDFAWPTFLWIYQTETQGLGWVYEKNI